MESYFEYTHILDFIQQLAKKYTIHIMQVNVESPNTRLLVWGACPAQHPQTILF